MLLISRHLSHYMTLPEEAVVRVNLAWEPSLVALEEHLHLLANMNRNVWFDLPTNRIKPPNNQYKIKDLIPLFNKFPNIKYLAISNVEYFTPIKKAREVVLDSIIIVPKIETVMGVKNFISIAQYLDQDERIVMLDHDDLFTDMIKHNKEPDKLYNLYIKELNRQCAKYNITLLKTAGVIFSDK